MREFKFRAVIDNNEIHKVFILNCDGSLEVSFGLIPKHRIKAILQYTGLKDINGKEIYEGDIVRIPEDSDFYEIRWKNRFCAYYAYCARDNCNIYFDEMKIFKVIGNIYQNPELLEN